MFAWRMVTRMLGLVSTLVLVRLLAPSDFGLISLAFSFTAALDACSALGTEAQIIRSREAGRELYDTAFTINLIRAAALGLVVAAAAGPVASWFGEPRLEHVLLLIALLTALKGLTNIRLVVFQRNLQFDREFLVLAAPRILQVLATIGFALWLRSYWAMIAGMFVGQGMGLVFGYALLPYLPRLTFSAWRELLGVSFWTWLQNLAQVARDRVDMFVIGRSFGVEQAGLYAIAAEIAALPITELVSPMANACMPGFAASLREHEGSTTARAFERVVALAFLLALPIGFGISLVAGPVVALALGQRWLSAAPLIAIMAIACIPIAPGLVAGALMVARARLRALFLITAGSALLRGLVVIGWARFHGLSAVAAAVGLVLLLENLVLLAKACRLCALAPMAMLGRIWRPLLGCGAMIAALWGAGLAWGPVPVLALAAMRLLVEAALVGATAFVATVLGLWLACGRPDGPESDLLLLVRRTLGDVLARVRPRPPAPQ